MANIYNEKAWIRYSQIPYADARNLFELQKNLEFLSQKLTLAQKQLTMFDFYKITTYVDSGSDYQTAVDNLLPNSSLVCTEPFIANGQSFGRGDIVYKYENGTIVQIKAERAGIYAPIQLSFDETKQQYIIKYKYYNYEPIQPSASAALNESASYAQEISFSLEGKESEKIYGEIITPVNQTISFAAVSGVSPILRFYSINGEEIYWDYKTPVLDINSQTYTLSDMPLLINKVVVK